MKVKIHELLLLNGLFEFLQDKILPAKTMYKFAQLQKIFIDEAQTYNEVLDKLTDKYAERDEEGCYFRDTNSPIGLRLVAVFEEEAKQQIQELNKTEIELPQIKFELEELERIQIPMKHFQALLPFISE